MIGDTRMKHDLQDPGDRSPLLDEQLAAGLRGDFTRGQEIAAELERAYPGSHRAAFNRAWYKMMQGRLLEGLECLDRGRWIGAFGDKPFPTNRPIYRDESLANRTILLTGEGGLGDEIINVRFARDFAERGARVVVSSDPSLTGIFARVPGVSAAVAHKGAPFVHHDFWVPGMSAAHVLRREYKDLSGHAYLSVDPAHREKWRRLLGEKYGDRQPRIGLRFYGNPRFEHEQHRRFPVDGLLSAVGSRAWVNLQKEETDLPIETWDDTLALLGGLDLVITSCTSVAHASAALGKETWVLVPILPYYLWALPGERSPWYDSVRLFRQTRYGDWSSTFDAIAEALEARET